VLFYALKFMLKTAVQPATIQLMPFKHNNLIFALLAGLSLALATFAEVPLHRQSLPELEQRKEAIDAELTQLARYSLRTGTGAIGYRSAAYDRPDTPTWVQVNFADETEIDSLILVPAIWRDPASGLQSDGFPRAFRILVGTDDDPDGHLIKQFTPDDAILPRIAPLEIPIPGVVASWIRIEATLLSPRAADQKYSLQFAEIMAFSGSENVALHQPLAIPVRTEFDGGLGWGARYATDGLLPYLMNSGRGQGIFGYFSDIIPEKIELSITVDLQQVQPISRIHLYTLNQGDTFPLASPSDVGFPRHLLIEAATDAAFSDRRMLVDFTHQSPYDLGPIMSWAVPPTSCRFVRLRALDPYLYRKEPHTGYRIGLSEIEILSQGRNVALNRPISTSYPLAEHAIRSLPRLTDGQNPYGKILPIRDWLEELALRHELETERPRIERELSRRYARQKTNLHRMGWLAALLAAGIGFTILIDRSLQNRKLTRIKERFAADLHDELGANLHTIGLLSDLAEEAQGAPEEQDVILQRIRAVSKQTGTAMRHCSDLIEANGIYTDMRSDMNRAAERIMANFEYGIYIEGEEHIARLNQRVRTDLFLFYKECLINILRHSGATGFTARITATPIEIQLTVHDNGSTLIHDMPPSLLRRAKLLRAKGSISTPAEGGNCIKLTLRPRKKLIKQPR
jgi:signal transduction histidine kinase